MKVASATHVDGTEVVVKVFAKHESLQLDSYRKKLEDIRRKLHGVANALPFQHFWVSHDDYDYDSLLVVYSGTVCLFLFFCFLFF